ncbi:tRNA-splicing endonuclease subunit Sen15 isoform X1 [Cygnus atratus]|uniref:tRNA-splicing endonuclease subunit Sen15 isoform X1 n=1 Tax=Cygnus atratus TaxID=8868 RepID=UPI0021B7BEF7|nr:tRNA-splicing endonuclease subunit Sen15 isoform X1 [Cygnus atratus]
MEPEPQPEPQPEPGRAEGGCGPPGGSSAGGRRWAGGAGGNWMAAHPAFTEMMSLDISDSSQIYAAFLVYLDLLEGRNWHEVKHVGLEELQLICLHAREREQDSLQVMVPVPVDISLSHESAELISPQCIPPLAILGEPCSTGTPGEGGSSPWLREIMKKASLSCDNPDTPLSVTLAIVESDSTVVYYKMTDGFVIPEPPDGTEDVDNKHWKKKRKKLSK